MREGFNNAVGPQVRAGRKNGKKPAKVIPTLAALVLGAGLQASTQYFAHQFGYAPALGANLDRLYPPWGILSVGRPVVRPVPGRLYARRQHRHRDRRRRSHRPGRCQNGGGQLGPKRASTCMARPAGPTSRTSGPPACSHGERSVLRCCATSRPQRARASTSVPGSTSAAGSTTCATTGPSTCCATRRPAPARAWAWWCRRCCRGARARSSPT